MRFAQRGQQLGVHLSCDVHGGMPLMQLFSHAEESVDGPDNVKLTLF